MGTYDSDIKTRIGKSHSESIQNTKWWIFLGAGLMILLINIDATIVNLALAKIAKNLNANLAQIQWIINAYLLTAMIFFIVGGKLADNYGFTRIFLIGTAIFSLASAVAGIAPNIEILIVGRLLQGVGFAFTLSLALIMISNAFPAKKRGLALGLAITLTGLGQALGPTLGGVILNELTWHWIFLINIPITFFSFIIIFLKLPTEQSKKERSLDYEGIILFGAAIVVLLLTINQLTAHQINLVFVLIGLIISFILFIIFYFQEIKKHNPLINFRLFLIRNYSLSIGIRAFYMYIYGTFLFFIPLFLQNLLGFSPLITGLMLLIHSSIFGICSPITGILTDQVGYRIPIITSAIICSIAFLLLTLITSSSSIYLILTAFVLFGLSASIMIPSTVNSTLSALPKSTAGEGLGMFFTTAFISLSLGIAISGVQMNFVGWSTFTKAMKSMKLTLPLSKLEILHAMTNGTKSIHLLPLYFTHSESFRLIPLVKSSFISGLTNIMFVNVILAILITWMSFLLKKN